MYATVAIEEFAQLMPDRCNLYIKFDIVEGNMMKAITLMARRYGPDAPTFADSFTNTSRKRRSRR